MTKRFKVTTTTEPPRNLTVLVYRRGAIIECYRMGKSYAYPWNVQKFEFETFSVAISVGKNNG